MAKSCWAAKLGVVAPGAVVFNSTDTVLEQRWRGQVGLAVAVEIPHRHRIGIAARGEVLLGGKAGVAAPGAVVFNSTETVLDPLAMARSGLPSPLRSPTATEVDRRRWQSRLSGKRGAAAPGAVVFNSTETVSDQVGAARSGMPSPLKSPTATAVDRRP